MSAKKVVSLNKWSCIKIKSPSDYSSSSSIQNIPKREKSESFKKQFNCYKCKKRLSSHSELVMHLKLIHNSCASPDCSKISDFKLHASGCIHRGFGCPVCDKKFIDKGMLLIHFNDHIDAAFYACEICREGFQLWKDLQKHMYNAHRKKIPSTAILSQPKAVYQKCAHCLKYFKLFAEFEEHVSTCNSSTYACDTCQIVFTTLTALDEHRSTEHKLKQALVGYMALIHGKRYFCGVCYLGFTKGDTLKKHLATHEMNVTFICDACNESFVSDDDLQEHYLQHVEEHYILHNVISQYSCVSCKKTFQNQQELKEHLEAECRDNGINSNSNNDECLTSEFEKEKGVNNTSQETVLLASDVDFNVSEIPIYVFKSGEELINCDDSECIVVMDLVSLFVFQKGICASESRMPDVTNSELYNENDVIDANAHDSANAHLFRIFTPASEHNTESSNLETNQTGTSETGETVTVNFETNSDSVQINAQNNFEITAAGNDFVYYTVNDTDTTELYEGTSTENVISEENKVPENHQMSFEAVDDVSLNDLFICEICKQVFSSKTSLCLHMNGCHTGFDCHHCGKSFSSDSELKNHEIVDHQIAFQCDECEVTYPKEDLLEKHKQSAHGNKEYVCNTCNKYYCSKEDYEDHLLLHREHEKTPTKCKICGKVFASVGNYLRHKEYMHDHKKYLCPICKADHFRTSNSVQVHLKTHVIKTPENHQCPVCKLCFDSNVFIRHVESHETE